MHATGRYRPDDPHAVAEHVTGADAEWTLEYDGALGLVSFEVWEDGRRLFGLDDWVG